MTDPDGHQEVTGVRSMSAIVRRYPLACPPAATTARVGDGFKERAQCTR